MALLRAGGLLLGLGLLGCGSSTAGSGGPATTGGGGGHDGGGTPHALSVTLQLTAGASGIKLGTQNGSTVEVPAASVIGKPVYWATTPGGEPVGNAAPIDFGRTTVDKDLKATWKTGDRYDDGPWEMATFISLTGGAFMKGPQSGDLAGFDLTPPPPGDPPVTGVSIRMDVHGADAEVTLGNDRFIRF